MTVGATTIKEKPRGRAPGRGRMLCLGVTLSAEPGIGNSEQAIVDRPVRLMAGGAILQDRRVFPKKGSAPLRVTGVTVFINSRLNELRWIRRSVRIMTVRTGELSFAKRHMGGAHELRFTLEMALAADFRLRALVKERGPVANLGKLISVGGFLHDGVATNATHATSRMWARFPVGLNAALMTGQTGFILSLHRLPTVFAESDQTANAFSAARRYMLAAGAMTILASAFFGFVARVKKENFSHLGLGKFFKLSGVASLANFVADVGGSSSLLSRLLSWVFSRFLFRRPGRPGDTEQEHTSQRHEKKSSHDSSRSVCG
jgi:hypothetical protein